MNIKYDEHSIMPYEHLEPLVDLLLINGNSLAKEYRWGNNRTGYFCLLTDRIDFELINREFSLPAYIKFNRAGNTIECHKTWSSITGGVLSRSF